VILVERATGGIFGGQIGLPGGKCEPGDDTPLATAMREAQEEIGLSPQQVRILTAIDPIQSRTSGIWVHSFVGKVPEGLCFVPRAGEIARVFTASAKEFRDPANRQQRLLMFATWTKPKHTECVVLDGSTVVWGLTLRILDAALPLVLPGE
jgi:8-oxo-dGTP pyrophosphatase MutT (NUDIX family)